MTLLYIFYKLIRNITILLFSATLPTEGAALWPSATPQAAPSSASANPDIAETGSGP